MNLSIPLIPSRGLRLLCLLAVLLLLAPVNIYAAKKSVKTAKGTVMACTGIRGLLYPKWPHKPIEIRVTGIEKGSPASFGELKVGDVIAGFGNKKFKKHPLWDMATAIEMAEGDGGKLSLLLKSGKQVDINLADIGSYSKTAPYNCPKTDKIIEKAAEALLKEGFTGGATNTGFLALMATGEKAHLDAVTEAINKGALQGIDPEEVDAYLKGGANKFGSCGWTWGYNLITLGEYYLLTKNEKVLPAMRTYALGLARGQDGVGFWGHKMSILGRNGRAPGYGTMNQPSLSNLLGMIIAQKCGISDPILDIAVKKSYATVQNVVGKGGFAYGSGGTYPDYYNNNGTSGSAAIIMSLKGNKDGASFFSQIAATSYDSLTSGHASSFFNPLWTPLGASLSGPEVTQQFFKKSLWYFSGKRDWKGGFAGRDKAGLVAGQALLMYCLPRKVLLITGREADSSIWIKGSEATEVIMRSKIDYKSKSVDELFAMFKDPIIQMRRKATNELAGRLKSIHKSKKKKPDPITPKLLSLIKKGSEQERVDAVTLLGSQSHHLKQLVAIINNKKEVFTIRVAAVSAIGQGNYGEAALPFYNDILELILEMRPEADPFGSVDNVLAKALIGMFKNLKTPQSREGHSPNKDLVYKVASKFLAHKRQSVRRIGMKMLIGISVKDFHIIADNLMHVLRDKDPNYHTYSSVLNADGLGILADLNIQEGLDLLVKGIFHGGGKWAFKYKALMKALPLYGANAEPYISKFEAHKDINKKGDRFTPAWEKAVKKIKGDTNPKKLMSVEEAKLLGMKR